MSLMPFAITWIVGVACFLIMPHYPAVAGMSAVGLLIVGSVYALGEEFGARIAVLLTAAGLCGLAVVYLLYENHGRFSWPQ